MWPGCWEQCSPLAWRGRRVRSSLQEGSRLPRLENAGNKPSPVAQSVEAEYRECPCSLAAPASEWCPCNRTQSTVASRCSLTPRSSRAPTAGRAGHQALGLRPILRLLSSTPHRRCRLNSNVRLRKNQMLCRCFHLSSAPARTRASVELKPASEPVRLH